MTFRCRGSDERASERKRETADEEGKQRGKKDEKSLEKREEKKKNKSLASRSTNGARIIIIKRGSAIHEHAELSLID